ncbi:MAG: DUF3276 family protein [Chitinophagales bacterium]|nr:DUF3276 family protein [Chitinophagales bacterium]
MENEKKFDNGVFSKRVKAGKRRTYFFDVRTTKNNDYYITITESKKRFNEESYDRHKVFVYKEDFVKFVNALQETVDHIKTELLPDYDFDAHNHDDYDNYDEQNTSNDEVVQNNDEFNSSNNDNEIEEPEKWD